MSDDERRDRDDLHELFQDAVSDVDPTHRLDEIRARTRGHSPRGWYAAGGAALLAAAVVALIAIVGPSASDSAEPAAPSGTSCDVLEFYGGPAGQPISTPTADACSSVSASPPPTESVSPSATDAAGTTTQIYYVGDTPLGSRLFAEPRGQAADVDAALEALMTMPADPDYTTRWPQGSLIGYEQSAGTVFVTVSRSAPVHDELARQQLAYTLEPLLARRSQILLSYQRGTAFAAYLPAPPSITLADVNITSPSERQHVSGSFTAKGVAKSFEGTVGWEIRNAQGKQVLAYSAQARSGIRLSPWQTTIDVSKLAPGTYTFSASTDDPTGGEGPGPTTDTRTIVVE